MLKCVRACRWDLQAQAVDSKWDVEVMELQVKDVKDDDVRLPLM